ncbi:MAG TPA: hypothetical protein VN896_03020 [Methylomirabilota bacterium]|nr:hypothetical protein [Methylomirabilota bacterium]
MRSLIHTLVLTSALAAMCARAAEMDPNPLDLPAAESGSTANRFELRVGGLSTDEVLGLDASRVLGVVYDRMVSPSLSVGIQLSQATDRLPATNAMGNAYVLRFTSYTVMERVAFHAINGNVFDFYAGGMLGFSLLSVSAPDLVADAPIDRVNDLVAGGFTGGRLWFVRHLGVSVEAGYDQSVHRSADQSGFSRVSGSVGLAVRF